MEIFGEEAINLFESIIILYLFVLKIIKSFFIIILNTNK